MAQSIVKLERLDLIGDEIESLTMARECLKQARGWAEEAGFHIPGIDESVDALALAIRGLEDEAMEVGE